MQGLGTRPGKRTPRPCTTPARSGSTERRSRLGPRTDTGRGRGVRQHRPAETIPVWHTGSPCSVVCYPVLWWPATAGPRSGGTAGDRRPPWAVTRPGSGTGRGLFPGPRPPALRHRRNRSQRVRRALVPSGTRCEGTGHQVLVRRAPHRTRCLLLAPVRRALRAAAPVVGFVIGQQRPPALDEPRKLRTRHGVQGSRVRVVGQLGKRVEPLADRVAQNLSQNLVHRYRHSLSCQIAALSGHRVADWRRPLAPRSGRAARRGPPSPGDQVRMGSGPRWRTRHFRCGSTTWP